MTLLLHPRLLEERRIAARGPLAPLVASLRHDLAPVVAAPPTVPRDKARLSRTGGICPNDGARLAFDPWSPDAHRCPRCGREERGDAHYRAWLMWYQLWLAERAVQGALLHVLEGDPDEVAVCTALLAQYAESYLAFPNRDNALGPSRLFFSTYLESIWLLQVCVALDLMETGGRAGALSGSVRDTVIEPAARLIAEFDEGGSNRQVWNDAALFAAGRLLGDDSMATRALDGPSGIVSHLANGLLADGTWFEGENYHMFAHRGLWYGLTMARSAGVELPGSLVRRFDDGYVTPWLTALPDLTLPSRRDSPYAVSLRQWRFAEMAELGLARSGDERLLGALGRLYSDDAPRRDTGRSRSAADVERNEPASALSRADLGWRALLHALPVLGELRPSAPGSTVLEGQGIGVFRRDEGRIYVALDYGHSGGGHGHPDRLGVMLCDGGTRWLDDPGTGSYVDRSLHWYRSTLAHNAPLVDGRSQRPTHGRLLAFDQRSDAGWIEAAAAGLAPGVTARRAIVVMSDYVVDTFEWSSTQPVRLDLPLHADGETAGAEWVSSSLTGARGLEDGFDFVHGAECAVPVASGAGGSNQSRHTELTLHASSGASTSVVRLFADPPVEWWRARAPGVPGASEQRFHLARWNGTAGRLTMVWDLRDRMRSCSATPNGLLLERDDGSSHEHVRTARGWRVDIRGAEPRTIELAGRVEEMPAARAEAPATPAAPPHVIRSTPLIFELGETHYRRSEQAWAEAGKPRALVAIESDGNQLAVGVRVFTPHPVFVPANALNDMDNEHADVNGDGIQIHIRAARTPPSPGAPGMSGRAASHAPGAQYIAGWVAIPEPGERVRVREVAGSEAGWLPDGGWQRMPDGYRLRLLFPLDRLGPPGPRPFDLDLIVNETAPGRERRRGQLVLSGARGEWVYLRGDRQPPERFLPFIIADA